MAPLPKRRHSSRRQAKRTRALKVSGVTLVKCAQCGQPTRPHFVCASCGFYNKTAVVIKKVKKQDNKK